MKISKRDINLLVGFLGILIAFLAYQFGYRNVQKEVEELETQNIQMETEIAELEALEANRDFYVSETDRMHQEISNWVGEFDSNTLPEDEMKFAYEQDNENLPSYLFINNMTFTDPALLYTTNQNQTNTEATADQADTASANVVTVENIYPTYYLYQTQTSYGMDCSYAGMKNMVRSVLTGGNRKAVENISLVYDDSTGQLNGTVLVDTYFVVGSDKPYAQPSLLPVRQGTDNIFGKMDILEQNEEAAE